MKAEATSSATVTSASLLFSNVGGSPSSIATGSTVQLWTEAGDGKMGSLIGSLSYTSHIGQLATYSGAVNVPTGRFWVKAVNTGAVSSSLAYADSPAATGTWSLVYGDVANWESGFYFINDNGRMLLSLASSPVAVGATSTQTPADQLQQVGMPDGGSCAAVDDSQLNYGTNVSGGWAKSWARWVYDQSGGPVCTRSLHYSNSAGGWIVL